jgi:uncharacterized repeat protein (TIGR03847 family)
MLADLPATSTGATAEWTSLDLPIFAEWDVGAIGLGYEADSDSIILVLNELERRTVGEDEAGEVDAEQARFRLTRAQAAAFALHGRRLVEAGRPTCMFCAAPIDPDGYNCACYN